jgi:hypothetical protein
MAMEQTIPGWRERAAALVHQAGARLRGPGGYYNIGNAFGLGMGIALQMESIPAGHSGLGAAADAATSYLVGNPAATARSHSAPPSSSGAARCTTAPGPTARRRTRF